MTIFNNPPAGRLNPGLKLAEREVMHSRAIHRTDPRPHVQTVAERRLNSRSDAQSSLRDEGRFSTWFRGLNGPDYASGVAARRIFGEEFYTATGMSALRKVAVPGGSRLSLSIEHQVKTRASGETTIVRPLNALREAGLAPRLGIPGLRFRRG